jgi:hypothetical protein
MVDIKTVSIAVASASVILGAIYYIWQIRHQSRIRQTDLVIRLSDFGTRAIKLYPQTQTHAYSCSLSLKHPFSYTHSNTLTQRAHKKHKNEIQVIMMTSIEG